MKKNFAILAAALAMVSCSSNKNSNSTANEAETIDITGNWSIKTAMGMSTEAGEQPAFINFDGNGEMNGNASVNSFFGSYELNGNQLSLSNVGMTRMMGQSMDIESAISDALDKIATIKTEGNAMFVFDIKNDTIMTLIKE